MVSKNICIWSAFRAAFGITVLVILLAGGAGAETLIVDDIADSYVNSATPETNYGSSSSLIAGTETWGSSIKIIYLKFNTSSIPAGMEILNATLNLRLSSGPFCGNPETISAYFVANNSWDEAGITYDNRPSLNITPEDTLSVAGTPPYWYSWRVTGAVKNRTELDRVSIALKGEGPGQCDKPFYPRNSTYAPFLEIQLNNPSQNFTFALLTDVHIGYFPKAVPAENNNATYMNYSVNNFTDTLQTVKRINPDFILITGDLVEYDKKDFFIAFRNLLKSVSIPVKGITPGNHDRRDKYSGLIGNNLSNYSKYIKPISNPASIDNNYSFDFKGYRFIGLDSGADYNVSIYDGIIMENKTTSISLSYDPSPESNGISNEQMTRLRGEFNNTAPKIVFMHHPVMDYTNDNYPGWPGRPVLPDGAPGGNNGAIAFNRWDFINYTRDSDVQLVLTGHSHYDAIFNIYGKPDKNSSSNRPIFIQTRSATKDENIRKGFRIVEVKDGKANPYNSVPTPRFSRITISVQFPPSVWYALNVYDSNGRHTGMNADCSDIELGIPNSYYTGDYGGFTSTPQVIVSYSGLKKLNVSNCLLRTSSGSSLQNIPFNLTLEYQTETSSVKVNFNNVTARSLEATDISKP